MIKTKFTDIKQLKVGQRVWISPEIENYCNQPDFLSTWANKIFTIESSFRCSSTDNSVYMGMFGHNRFFINAQCHTGEHWFCCLDDDRWFFTPGGNNFHNYVYIISDVNRSRFQEQLP